MQGRTSISDAFKDSRDVGEKEEGDITKHLVLRPVDKNEDVSELKDMIEECRQHSVPLFIKQLGSFVTHRGERIVFQDGHASDWTEWPEWLKLRQMSNVGQPLSTT